jgi:hypothetical protein
MMKSIPLKGRIKGGESLDFLAVQVPFEADRYIPFALVQYAILGMPQNEALRLDLDKRTFADHLANPAHERIVQDARNEIISIVSQALRRLTYERLQREFGD